MTCCEDCVKLREYRDKLLAELENVMRDVGDMRPGSADCDVNPISLLGPQREAMQSLELSHSLVIKMFISLGVLE